MVLVLSAKAPESKLDPRRAAALACQFYLLFGGRNCYSHACSSAWSILAFRRVFSSVVADGSFAGPKSGGLVGWGGTDGVSAAVSSRRSVGGLRRLRLRGLFFGRVRTGFEKRLPAAVDDSSTAGAPLLLSELLTTTSVRWVCDAVVKPLLGA